MSQIDPFSSLQRGLKSPTAMHFTIIPADGADLPIRPRVLRELSSGDLVLCDASGATISYPVAVDETLLFSAAGLEAAGISATVAEWD